MKSTGRRFAAVACSLLVVAGTSCGSDSDSGSASSGDKEVIVAYIVSQAKELGIIFDEDCAADVIDQLSAADAKLLADSARAGESESPTLSAEGEALGEKLSECADVSASTTTG